MTRTSVLSRYGVLVASDLASRAMGFAATLLIVRRFHDVGLGQIGVATAVVAYGVIASTCGLDVYAVRTVAQTPDSAQAMARRVIAIRTALGAMAYVVLLIASTVLPQFRDVRPLVAVSGLSVFTGAFAVLWVPQALHRTNVLAIATFFTGLLYLTGVGLLIGFRGPLWGVPLAQVVAETCMAVGMMWWLLQTTRATSALNDQTAPRNSVAHAWRHAIRQASPIGGAALLRTVALGSDLLLLRLLFVPDANIGWYNGAWRIFGLMLGMTSLYFVILFPRLSARASQPAALRHEVRQSLMLAGGVAVLVAACAIVLAPFGLTLLFGAAFGAGANSLRILSVAIVAFVLAGHFKGALVASGRQQTDLWLTGGVVVLHIVVKLLLIPRLGIAGAATGTLIGETGSLLLAWYLARGVMDRAAPPASIR